MKHYLSALLAVTLLAALTACGGGAGPVADASNSPMDTASAAATPSQTAKEIPDVTGETYQEAMRILSSAGLSAVVVDKNGKPWINTVPDASTTIMSTFPAAGARTVDEVSLKVKGTEAEAAAKAKAAADAAALAIRYEFTCGGSWSSSSSTSDTYHSLKEVWASEHYAGSDTCSITIDGDGIYDHPLLNPSEKAIAKVVAAAGGGGGGSPESDFGRVLDLCTKLDSDYADSVVARMDWKKAEAKGALALCPNAPHVEILREVATSVKIGDGTYTVGNRMEPGTYQTKPNAKDCYWSRTTGGGDIIANDFVGFAPDGVIVTVFAGEGFESKYCGVWTKIG